MVLLLDPDGSGELQSGLLLFLQETLPELVENLPFPPASDPFECDHYNN